MIKKREHVLHIRTEGEEDPMQNCVCVCVGIVGNYSFFALAASLILRRHWIHSSLPGAFDVSTNW